MWLMPRASREGRGGDSGVAVRKVSNKSRRVYSPEEYQARIRAARRSRHRALAKHGARAQLSRDA
jgi:hypothetical protein